MGYIRDAEENMDYDTTVVKKSTNSLSNNNSSGYGKTPNQLSVESSVGRISVIEKQIKSIS